MATGKVKWFNNAKGYGFIVSETGTEDLFAHYSAIEMEGYKTLKAGQNVEFEVQPGNKGLHATHIKLLDTTNTLTNVEANFKITEKSQAAQIQTTQIQAAQILEETA